MKKKKLYQILPMIMVGICMIGMCAVGIRIFAKRILIGKLGIENYITCTLADYNWGDRLERTMPAAEDEQEKSEELTRLENILAAAPGKETGTGKVTEIEETSGTEETSETEKESETETQKDAEPELAEVLTRYTEKISAVEDDINRYCNEKFLFYRQMRNISKGFDDMADWRLAYARTTGSTYTLSTGYDYQAVEAADMSAYAEDVMEKQKIAEAAGVDFLYVQFPCRVDEENSQVPWGASSYENENIDAVLEQLSEAEVDTLDLRKALTQAGWTYDEGFYDTDGHWTTRSGFLSAGLVAEYLNEQYGFAYDMARYGEANYDVRSYSVNSYAVEEEVELFLPDFDTDFRVLDAYRNEEYGGSFEEACFDMTKAETEEYSSVLTAYSASRIRNSYLFEYQNLESVNNQKRILITSDSFSWHLIPYLALDAEYVDYVYKMTAEQMEYYIAELQPDMVIVMDKPYY